VLITTLTKSTIIIGQNPSQTLTPRTLTPSGQNPSVHTLFPKTFVTFSKFHLNTQKSPNIKALHLFEGHNFHNWRHFKFWVEDLQKLGQRQHLPFDQVEKDTNFSRNLCLIHSSKTLSTFVKLVARCFLYKFAIERIWTSIQVFGVWISQTCLPRRCSLGARTPRPLGRRLASAGCGMRPRSLDSLPRRPPCTRATSNHLLSASCRVGSPTSSAVAVPLPLSCLGVEDKPWPPIKGSWNSLPQTPPREPPPPFALCRQPPLPPPRSPPAHLFPQPLSHTVAFLRTHQSSPDHRLGRVGRQLAEALVQRPPPRTSAAHLISVTSTLSPATKHA
jgi:hypothetical protein